MASGYGKHELIRHYMELPIMVTFFSALIGNLLGYTVMPILFKDMFYSSYSLPPMEISLNLVAVITPEDMAKLGDQMTSSIRRKSTK